MNHWAFVTAAYVITLGGTAAVSLWAWATMRAAEKEVQK
jgi:hypothetical protein